MIQCRTDVLSFVERRLCEMLACPRTWGWSKEAFASQVTLLVEFVSDAAWSPGHFMQKLFPGETVGGEWVIDDLDDTWVRWVIDAAREELRNGASHQSNVLDRYSR